MLDAYARPIINPPLDFIGKHLARIGVSANHITITGFIAGLLAMVAIFNNNLYTSAGLICLNRLLDGLDGAVARNSKPSDFGGFLDIVCDFIVYAGVIFAFGLADPAKLSYSAFLVFSFIGPIASFLAYAIIAAKNQINSTRTGIKSFYYLGGICEGTETAAVMILACLIPQYFYIICIIYGILCWLTTIGRTYSAWQDFGKA